MIDTAFYTTPIGESSAPSHASIKVSMLMNHLRRNMSSMMQSMLFEPNDEHTQAICKEAVETYLAGLIDSKGIYDFSVQCDSDNNRSDNTLIVDIAIKPVESVGFFYTSILAQTAAELPKPEPDPVQLDQHNPYDPAALTEDYIFVNRQTPEQREASIAAIETARATVQKPITITVLRGGPSGPIPTALPGFDAADKCQFGK